MSVQLVASTKPTVPKAEHPFIEKVETAQKQLAEISPIIDQAEAELKAKFPTLTDDRLKGIAAIQDIANLMILHGEDMAQIRSRVESEIAALSFSLEDKMRVQRAERAKKTTSFGTRLSHTDFPQRSAEIGTALAASGFVVAKEMEHARLIGKQSKLIASQGIKEGATKATIQSTEVAIDKLTSAIGKSAKAVASAERTRKILGLLSRVTPIGAPVTVVTIVSSIESPSVLESRIYP